MQVLEGGCCWTMSTCGGYPIDFLLGGLEDSKRCTVEGIDRELGLREDSSIQARGTNE